MSKLLEQINTEERIPLVLSDYIKIKHGFAFKGEYFGHTGSHIVVTPGNFNEEGGFRRRVQKDKWYSGLVHEDYILKEGDLIVAMTEQDEGLLGSSALVPTGDLFLHNQRIGLVQMKDEQIINKQYLYYLFNTRPFRSWIRSSASGTKVRHTSPDRITAYEYAFPAISTQKKIAKILSAYDVKIETNNKEIKFLEELMDITFNEWFNAFRFPGWEKVKMIENEIGNIPAGWEVKNVLEVIERIPVGKKFENKTAYPIGKVPILDQGASGFIGYHDEEPGVIASVENPVAVFTNHTCYYRLLTEPFSCIQNVLPYVGKNGYSTLFVYLLTRNKIKMQEYKGHWPEFEQQVFVIPPVELANAFTERMEGCVTEIVSLGKENISLKSQRDQLLIKLV